jgi:GNAT superfamily N-acetyltransferase
MSLYLGGVVARKLSIFISYAHADKKVAQGIASGLSAHGVRVWIDEGELRVGDSLIERILEAVHDVHFVVGIVSPNSVSSSWCQKELAMALDGGLKQKRVKVLPLRLGNVEMPPILASTLYLNVDDPNDLVLVVERLFRDAVRHYEEHFTVKNGRKTQGVYQVRLAALDDMEATIGLFDEASVWLRNKGTDQWAAPWPTKHARNKRIFEGIAHGITWAVEFNDRLVGTVTCGKEGNPQLWDQAESHEPAVYLSRLIVCRSHAGRGIGAALINWAGQHGRREWNACWIRADAWTNNSGLHTYLEAQGFRLVRIHPFSNHVEFPSAALFQKPVELADISPLVPVGKWNPAVNVSA